MKLYKLTQELYQLYGNIQCVVSFPHGAHYGVCSGLNGMLTDVPAIWADEVVRSYTIDPKAHRVDIVMV